MPSPFPGMDPYLERTSVFPGFQRSLITYICESLQPNLPDPYFAEIDNRSWWEEAACAGISHDKFREPFVDIMARIEGEERIITTVEILSLTNKTPGKHGRELYLQKQREVLDSEIHLVEIDLLRAGEHSTAVPLERALKKTGEFDYHVCVHCFDHFEDYYVYPFTLRDSLPEIAVPLLPDDGFVALDLQQVFGRCYETGPYHRRIRYGESPIEPDLSEGDAAWAAGLLKATSLR